VVYNPGYTSQVVYNPGIPLRWVSCLVCTSQVGILPGLYLRVYVPRVYLRVVYMPGMVEEDTLVYMPGM